MVQSQQLGSRGEVIRVLPCQEVVTERSFVEGISVEFEFEEVKARNEEVAAFICNLFTMVKGHVLPVEMPSYHEDIYACESMVSFDSYEDDIKDNVKRKTRNLSEKKRRDQFNMLVNELCSMVSINSKKMDKSTVLKSTIAFLKNHQEITVKSQMHEIREDWKPSFLSNDEFSQLMLEALDSFLIVFTIKGKILYVSESVSSLLGHIPSDLVHKSIYKFIHEYDKERVTNLLRDFKTTAKASEEFTQEENQISFQCHLQCGATSPRQTKVYEAVELTGTCRPWDSDDEGQMDSEGYIYMRSSTADTTCLCCTVRLQKAKIICEMPVSNDLASEFTSRHSLGWKFLFLDHRAPPVIGYLPFEVLGTSGYDYYHPDDLEKIANCHEQLMTTGEGMSCHYRFLTKGQQWIWLKTRYYITYHQWNSKPEFIVCTNTVVSFSEVRSALRKDTGQMERDVDMEDTDMEKPQDSPPCSVTSGPSSVTQEPTTPETVLSGTSQTECSDGVQMPHSTQLDTAKSSKSVSSHHQTLIQPQQPPPLQPQQQPPLPQPQQQPPPPPLQQHQTPQPPPRKCPRLKEAPSIPPASMPMPRGMVPVSSLPHGMLTLQQKQLSALNAGDAVNLVSSVSPGTGGAPEPRLQASHPPQMFLTPAQQILQEQLRQKSELLQDAIRQQQEELRQITEQLTRTHAIPTPTVPGMGDNSGQQLILQPPHQSMALPTQPAMMIQQLKALDLIKQQQQQQQMQLQQQVQLHQQHLQLQQVHHQMQLQQQQQQQQPCLPFQIVPEAEDISFGAVDMTDS